MQKLTKHKFIESIEIEIWKERSSNRLFSRGKLLKISHSTRRVFPTEWLADANSAARLFVRLQQTYTMMRNCPDHAADSSNHLPVASKADKKQMMSVPPPYWVISLIECNWVMHRSVERRHRATAETAGRGGAQELLSHTRTGFII